MTAAGQLPTGAHLVRQRYELAGPTRLVDIWPAQVWDAATSERNWLVYKLVPSGDRLDKHPADPATGRAPISIYNAAHLTFAEALDALDRLGEQYGLGYLPRSGSALIGLDFDKCIVPWDDEPAEWAADMLAYTYTWAERSPSGFGVRVVAERSHYEPWSPTLDSEANGCGYFAGGGRFFTITFALLPGRMHRIYPEQGLIERVLVRTGHRTARAVQAQAREAEPEATESHWFARLTERRQIEEVERMLAHLTDPKFGEYELWLRVSFAVYRATDSCGFEAWDRWCQRLPGYHAEQNAKKWASGLYERSAGGLYTGPGHGGGAKVTVGTLIMHARQHGYQLPLDAGFDLSGVRRVMRSVWKPKRQAGRAAWRW